MKNVIKIFSIFTLILLLTASLGGYSQEGSGETPFTNSITVDNVCGNYTIVVTYEVTAQDAYGNQVSVLGQTVSLAPNSSSILSAQVPSGYSIVQHIITASVPSLNLNGTIDPNIDSIITGSSYYVIRSTVVGIFHYELCVDIITHNKNR